MVDPIVTSHHGITPHVDEGATVNITLDGREINVAAGQFLIAAAEDAGVKLGGVAGFFQQVDLERQERFFSLGCGQVGDQGFQTVENGGMGVVFFDQEGDEFGGVKGEV